MGVETAGVKPAPGAFTQDLARLRLTRISFDATCTGEVVPLARLEKEGEVGREMALRS